MAKIVKTLTVSWQWSGDKYSLRGFNLAVTPAAKNPKEEVVATAFVETKEIKQTYSYKMGNVTLDKDAQYKIWVQAVYENSDSDWVATGGATVSDDGSATIITKTDREIQDIVNMASDNILTRQEKISLRREWQEIVYEFLEIESTAISQGIPSSNTAFSNFKSKGNALGTYLNGGTAWTISSNNKTSFPLWINDSNLGSNTSINGNTYRETFRVYYEAKVKILEEINKYKVNNIQVGGRNLWIIKNIVSANIPSNTTNGELNSGVEPQHRTMSTLTELNGAKYVTVQLWNPNKINNASNSNRIAFFDSNKNFISISSNTPKPDGSSYKKQTFDVPSNAAYMRIGMICGNTSYDESIKIKVELGNKATDWTPAPEDLENAYTIILTNEAQVIPTNSNRVPTSSTTYFTDIQIYKGTAQRNDYTIGTVDSANGITVSKTSSRVNFAVSTNTALATDGGNFIIPITIDGKTFNKTFSWSCSKQGNTGASGVGISKITEYYAVSSSNTTEPTSWSTTVPAMTATNKYLWNYETITYSNNTTANTSKRVIGVYGDKGNTGATGATGNGISNIVNYYLATSSSSGVTTSTSGWTTSVQAISASKKYLWNYEVITYTNNSTTTSTPCIIGTYGDKGDTGATGPQGSAGKDAYTVILTNESHTFPAENNGSIASDITVTTDVLSYKGASSITPTIGTLPTVNGLTLSKTNNRVTIVAKSGTALADSGSFNIPIIVDGKSFTKTFSWAKSRKGNTGATGATGAGAKTADIIASSQVFKSADGGKTFLPDTITLTPTLQNVTFSKWQYSTDGGRSWSNVSSGSNGLSVSGNNLQISKSSNLFTSTNTTVVFKVVTNDSAIYDTMTIVKLYDVTELEVGGRNYIRNGKGDKKAGFFKNFNAVTGGYGELTLTSQKTYSNISIADGFVLGCRDYEVGRKMVFSYDIMYTKWNFPSGTNRNEFWIGQRYTNSSTSTDGQWRGVTQHNLPVVGENGCKLNEWYHVSKIITIPKQAEATIGTASSIQFYNSNADVSASFTARFKNVKLEYGNVETDWTPAPEDVNSNIDDVKNSLNSFQNTVNTSFKDGIIEQAEAKAIAQHLKTLDAEKADIDKEYSTIYGNSLLGGAAKTNLANAKTSFDSAHSSLKSTINTAISDGKVTSTEKANVDSTFTTYNGVLGTYKQRIQEALDAISSAKVNNIQVGGRNLLKDTSKELKSVTFGGWDYYFPNNITSWEKNKTLTGNIYLKPTEQDASCMLHVRYKDSSYKQYRGNIISAGREGYSTVTITVPNSDDISHIQFSIRHSASSTPTDVVYYKEAKVEKGNKATDWTPAPEDIDAEITAVNNKAQDSINKLTELASDSKLTASEKLVVKREWDAIVGEKTKITSEADKFGVSKTDYESKYNTLNSYITPLLSNLTTTSDINGSTFRSNFTNYYNSRQDLLNAITTKVKTLADNAQSTANTANNTANTVNTTVNNNKNNWSNAYNRVAEWARGAVTGSVDIDGGKIAANTIIAEKIAVGDFNNYATVSELNPATMLPSSHFGGTKIVSPNSTTTEIAKTNSSNAYLMLSGFIPTPFVVNDELLISFKAYNCLSEDKAVTFSVWYYDANKKHLNSNNIAIRLTSKTWKQYEVSLKLTSIDTNVRYVVIGFSDNNGTDLRIRNPRVVRKSMGKMIVDGTIEARHIKSDVLSASTIVSTINNGTTTISGGKITSGTITATQIASGSITATQIASDSITADKLTIGMGESGGLSKNPRFTKWSGTYPDGTSAWVDGGISKVSVDGKNVAQFTCSTAGKQYGMNLNSSFFGAGTNLEGIQYFVLECKFRLTSGTNPSGASFLFDVMRTDDTYQRLQLNMTEAGTTLTTNTWYTVRKVFMISDANLAKTFKSVKGYLLGNWLSAGDAVKTIQFASANVYIATKQDYLTQTWTSGTEINGASIKTGTLSADKITTGTLDANKVNVTNIKAGNIVSGTIDASKISVTNLNASNIKSGTLSADRIASNSISTNKLAIADFTNYCELNPDYLMGKFTQEADSSQSNNPWLVMSTLSRDTVISRTYRVSGGESYRITAEISTTVRGATSNGGSTIDYLDCKICCYGKKRDGSNYWHTPAGKKNSSGTISVTTTIPSDASTMFVAIQLAGHSPFSGVCKVRNIRVTRMNGGDLIVDGAVTATKMNVKGLTVSNGSVNTLAISSSGNVDINANSVKVNVSGTYKNVADISLKVDKTETILNQQRAGTRCHNLGAKINYSSFSASDEGEIYLHGFDSNNNPSDSNGTISFNGKTYTITKGVINPDNRFGTRDVYLFTNVGSNTNTYGCYYDETNKKWKYIGLVGTSGTGDCNIDNKGFVAFGQFRMSASEVFDYAYLYEAPTMLKNVATSFSTINSRLTSAESKITDNAIINTVQSTINTAKNDAINSANSTTDNKLKNYATTSSLTQTANDITASFKSSGGYNLVENSTGFNANNSGWANTGNNNSKIRASVSSSSKLQTGYFLCLDRQGETDTNANAGVSRRFKLKPNTTYTVSGMVMSNPKTKGIRFMVKTSDTVDHTDVENRKDHTTTYTVFNGKATSWTQKSLTFTTGADVKSGVVYFDHLGFNEADTGTTTNRVYWSQVILAEGSLAQQWSPHPNEVYSGITKIDASGIQVSHTGAKTTTHMNSQGFFIYNSQGETVGSLATETGLSIVNANKVYADNIPQIYEGDSNLYVNHNHTGSNQGTSQNPFRSFADLKRHLESQPIINKNLSIYIQSTGGDITEQLFLTGLTGSGWIWIYYDKACVHRQPVAGGYSIVLDNITNYIGIEGNRSNYNSNDGAIICDGWNAHGISIANCSNVFVGNINIHCQNWGIKVARSRIRTRRIDFCGTWCCLDLSQLSHGTDSDSCGGSSSGDFFRLYDGSIFLYGDSGGGYRPVGGKVETSGRYLLVGNERTATASFRTPPPKPTTSDQYGTWSMRDYGYFTYGRNGVNVNSWNPSSKRIQQGEWSGYGNNYGFAFFDDAGIRSWLSNGTPKDGSTITLKRASSGGYSSSQPVYLCGATNTSCSGTPSGVKSYGNIGSLAWGETKTFNIPTSFVNDLKSGAIKSVCFYDSSGASYVKIDSVSIKLKANKPV